MTYKEQVVRSIMDLDKDKDGQVTPQEFLTDLQAIAEPLIVAQKDTMYKVLRIGDKPITEDLLRKALDREILPDETRYYDRDGEYFGPEGMGFTFFSVFVVDQGKTVEVGYEVSTPQIMYYADKDEVLTALELLGPVMHIQKYHQNQNLRWPSTHLWSDIVLADDDKNQKVSGEELQALYQRITPEKRALLETQLQFLGIAPGKDGITLLKIDEEMRKPVQYYTKDGEKFVIAALLYGVKPGEPEQPAQLYYIRKSYLQHFDAEKTKDGIIENSEAIGPIKYLQCLEQLKPLSPTQIAGNDKPLQK